MKIIHYYLTIVLSLSLVQASNPDAVKVDPVDEIAQCACTLVQRFKAAFDQRGLESADAQSTPRLQLECSQNYTQVLADLQENCTRLQNDIRKLKESLQYNLSAEQRALFPDDLWPYFEGIFSAQLRVFQLHMIETQFISGRLRPILQNLACPGGNLDDFVGKDAWRLRFFKLFRREQRCENPVVPESLKNFVGSADEWRLALFESLKVDLQQRVHKIFSDENFIVPESLRSFWPTAMEQLVKELETPSQAVADQLWQEMRQWGWMTEEQMKRFQALIRVKNPNPI